MSDTAYTALGYIMATVFVTAQAVGMLFGLAYLVAKKRKEHKK